MSRRHARRASIPLLVVALTVGAAPLAAAQQAAAGATPAATGVAADLLADVSQVETKLMALARAFPAERFDWRPAAGVRSVSEVLRHIAADNYLMPATMGHAADPATGIRGDDYTTAQAFEQRPMTRDEAIAQMERSFAHLRRALAGTTPERMGEKVSLFGHETTAQSAWIMTVTHLHEHLGQLIAYARSNGVVPPWSE